MLLDLMGGSDVPTADLGGNLNGSQNTADLLADILGGDTSSTPAPQPSSGQASNINAIMDLLGSNGTPPASQKSQALPSRGLLGDIGSPPAQTPSPNSAPAAHTVFTKNGLLLTFQVHRNDSGAAQILARFRNTSSFDRFTGVALQAAVPKAQKLQLGAINKPDLNSGEDGTQGMRVAAISGVRFTPPQAESIRNLVLKTRNLADGRFWILGATGETSASPQNQLFKERVESSHRAG